MKKMFYIVLGLFAALFFLGCSAKQEESNKPADYWYQKMVKETNRGDLEHADGAFTSLQSEHFRSILIPEAMLILAEAHTKNEEYILANYYLDEYLKRFGDKKNIDYIRYLKVRANFMAFKRRYRDQQLLLDTIKDGEEYLKEFPNSVYVPFVNTILVKLSLAKKQFNTNISSLYSRVDKPAASKLYAEKAESDWTKGVIAEKPDVDWYRYLFEDN